MERADLEALLAEYEATLAEAKAQMHRVEGGIVAIRDMLGKLEKEENP